jgi:catechol 2,3-dioxygenase-like lactoylglutathione lyase family enzyme
MITGIDHIEIVVKDIDAMATFFTRLGFTEIRRTDHHGKAVELQVPGAEGIVIEFHTGYPTETPGINHIAFRVDDTVETATQFRELGVDINEPKVAENSGRAIASFRDPMHMRWQLSE